MKSDFYAAVLKMFTGQVGAFFFWGLAMLVGGRLYTPEYFGGGQLFVSVASVLSVVATGRYETALTIPRFHFQAMQLLLFSAALSVFFTVGGFLILIGFSDIIAQHSGVLPEIFILVPLYMLELSLYALFYGWMVRARRFAIAARGLVLFPLSYLVLCVTLYYVEIPIHKLILAILLARGIEILYYGCHLYGDIKECARSVSWQSIFRRAKCYIDFPQYMLVGSFVDMMSVHVAPFLITFFWGMEAAGYYFMATQVLSAPAGLIVKSVGDVFRQEGAQVYGRKRECKMLYRRFFRLCMLYSAIVCVFAYVAVPTLLPIFLGAKWNVAGEYIQWLLPMTFISLVASPLSTMYIIARRQKTYIWIQLLMLLTVIIGLGIGHQGYEIKTAFLMWGGLSIVVGLISIYGGWTIANGTSE